MLNSVSANDLVKTLLNGNTFAVCTDNSDTNAVKMNGVQHPAYSPHKTSREGSANREDLVYASVPPMSQGKCGMGVESYQVGSCLFFNIFRNQNLYTFINKVVPLILRHNCNFIQGKLMVCGGYDRGECLSAVEMFDSTSNTWAPVKSMISKRGRFGVTKILKDGHETLYAVAGSSGQMEESSVEKYDNGENWTHVADLPVAMSYVGMSISNSQLFIHGVVNSKSLTILLDEIVSLGLGQK